MKKDKIYIVYFVKLSSKIEDKKNPDIKNELFFKCGITRNSVASRLKDYKSSYNVVVQETIKLPENEARRLEKEFLSSNFRYKYYSKKKLRSGGSELLQNKMHLRGKTTLKDFYATINSDEARAKYYEEKEARAEEKKQKYFDEQGWW